MLIHRDAFVVHEVTTAEETRYFLNGALIDQDGRTVATDGHVLVRFTSDKITAERFPAIEGLGDVMTAEAAILSRDDIKAALATLPKSDRGPLDSGYVAVVPNGKTVTIATAKLDRTVQITARKIDGTFPAYEKVLAMKKPASGVVAFDPKYLETIGRMARQVGAKTIVFTLQNEPGNVDVKDPAFFTAKGEHGTLDGAIMPMRT